MYITNESEGDISVSHEDIVLLHGLQQELVAVPVHLPVRVPLHLTERHSFQWNIPESEILGEG